MRYPRPNARDLRVVEYVRRGSGWKSAADRFDMSVYQVKSVVRRNAMYESERLMPFGKRSK